MRQCKLWLTKEQIEPRELKGGVAVVIDVLLATTTLATLMERGAHRIFPVSSINEALQLKEQLGPDTLTGGEEGGGRVSAFDLGHLYTEYTEEKINNKNIVFLSTNGTRAIRGAEAADTVLIANLRNAHAIVDYLNSLNDKNIFIICAGSMGNFSVEDYLCASIIASKLDVHNMHKDDAALFASKQQFQSQDEIMDLLRKSRVGQSMLLRGLEDMLEFTGEIGASQSLIESHDRQLQFLA